jgi:hypothetical protein
MAGRCEGEYPFLRRRRWLRVGRVLVQCIPIGDAKLSYDLARAVRAGL